MAELETVLFPCLSDNYGVLIHDRDSGVTASIDAPDAATVKAMCERKGWTLTHILCTHHHHDHVGGIEDLKADYKCEVIGPRDEADKIPGLDIAVGDGDEIAIGRHSATIIGTPGHTLGHIAYWFKGDALAFVGDTLFAMGCGRVSEGTFEQMWGSLSKLAALPHETRVYCGHEYTAANGAFALTVDPDNQRLNERVAEVARLREGGMPTIPTTIGLEHETNPFLRATDPGLQANLGMVGADAADVFAEVRKRKDAA